MKRIMTEFLLINLHISLYNSVLSDILNMTEPERNYKHERSYGLIKYIKLPV